MAIGATFVLVHGWESLELDEMSATAFTDLEPTTSMLNTALVGKKLVRHTHAIITQRFNSFILCNGKSVNR